MIQCLPTATTHNAPVNEIKAPNPQVISRENFIPCGCPNKERDTPGCLNLLNTFPWKNNGGRTMQLMIKQTDIKIPVLRQLPSHTITINH